MDWIWTDGILTDTSNDEGNEVPCPRANQLPYMKSSRDGKEDNEDHSCDE